MRFVHLSRRDVLTKGTQHQIAGNNGAWVANCGNPPPYSGPKDDPAPVFKAPPKTAAKPSWYENLWYPASWK